MDTLKQAEAILATLIAFDTVSSGSNEALIAWIERYLDQYGVWHERVQEHSELGMRKTSLLARIGPDVPGGIVLSGHTDVVPVEGQQWSGGQGAQTAFTLIERDGKLYGRGAADMKGFIALTLAQVPAWVQLPLKRPVWLAFSHDEEIGCKCAEPMTQEFSRRGIDPALVIVGEPTSMQVVDEHKGIESYETVITGKAGHSSKPEDGIHAGYILCELVLALRAMNEAQPVQPNSRFPTPHSTLHAGTMNAGTARNIIPDRATLCWEVRPLPEADVSAILKPYHDKAADLRMRHPGCTIATRRLSKVHGLRARGDDAPHITLAKRLAGSNAPTAAVSYGTEGGAMGNQFPTVICGPGSIDQAHQPDEYIERVQLALGAAMLVRVGEVLCE